MLPLLLSAALLAPADADTDPVATPKGTPPILVVGQLDKAGNFISRVTVTQVVPVSVTETVTVNGRQVQRTVTRYQMVQKVVEDKRDLSKATVTTATGKKLDKAALAKRLAKPAAVVFSADGKAVDKGYLAMFKPETIVIAAPVTPVGTTAPVAPPGVAK